MVPCLHSAQLARRCGRVSVVDFEWSRLDVWVVDLARLHLGIWTTRPDLRDAFLNGYGREPDDADRAMSHGCAALTTVWMLVKAHESRQQSFEDGNRAALQRLIASRRTHTDAEQSPSKDT